MKSAVLNYLSLAITNRHFDAARIFATEAASFCYKSNKKEERPHARTPRAIRQTKLDLNRRKILTDKITDPGVYWAHQGACVASASAWLVNPRVKWWQDREWFRTSRSDSRTSVNEFFSAAGADDLYNVFGDNEIDHGLYINRDGRLVGTPNDKYGWQDRQVICSKPSKYLQGLGLSAEEIKSKATKINAALNSKAEVKFAETAEEITRVYTEGPDSCMSYTLDRYETNGIHPCSIYGEPSNGIAVAYLERGDRIVARTVVVPEEKAYIRIYGSETALRQKLELLGYGIDGGALYGLKLTRIKLDEHHFVAPFLDGGYTCLEDDGEHLIIGEEGPFEANRANGTVSNLIFCEYCESQTIVPGSPEDDPHRVSRYNHVCDNCLDAEFTLLPGETRYIINHRVCETQDTHEAFDRENIPSHIVRVGWGYYTLSSVVKSENGGYVLKSENKTELTEAERSLDRAAVLRREGEAILPPPTSAARRGAEIHAALEIDPDW